MHWNGRGWQTTSTPRIRLPKGEAPVISGLVAFGPKNAWWSYTPETSDFKVRPGSAMPHWNGKRWTSVRLPAAASGAGLAAQDGHGGLWLQSILPGSGPLVTVAFHYTGAGRWTREVPPIPSGFNSTDLDMFWIPHSRSLWAIGYAHASSDVIEAVTERYTP
jgi:hypothetical protein